MIDPHSGSGDGLGTPARRAYAVAPHDTDPLPVLAKALWVGAAGTVALRAIDGTEDVSFTVPAGQILPVRVSHVRAAGTSAGNLVALA